MMQKSLIKFYNKFFVIFKTRTYLLTYYNTHFCSSQTEVFYFCRDGRILPALGQQSFVMIALEQPNKMRLFNVEESIKDALKTVVIKTQPHLAHLTESEEFTEFKWDCPVWNHTLDENEPKVLKKSLISCH